MGRRLRWLAALSMGMVGSLASSAAVGARPRQVIVSNAPEGTPWADLGTRGIAQHLNQALKGKVKIRAVTGGGAGGEVATAEMCARGEIFLWVGSIGSIANVVPSLGALELPFLFRSEREVDGVWADPLVMRQLRATLHNRGFTFVESMEIGWRSFAGKKPLRAPADFTGLRVRSQPNPMHLEMWRLLGARAFPISIIRTAEALQDGMVQAFDNSPVMSFASTWYQSIDTISLSRHIYQRGIVAACKDTLAGLSRSDRALIRAGVPRINHQGTKEVRQLGREVLAQFPKEGVKVVELTPAELAGLAARTRPIYAWYRKRARPTGRRLLAAIEKKLQKLRKGRKKP